MTGALRVRPGSVGTCLDGRVRWSRSLLRGNGESQRWMGVSRLLRAWKCEGRESVFPRKHPGNSLGSDTAFHGIVDNGNRFQYHCPLFAYWPPRSLQCALVREGKEWVLVKGGREKERRRVQASSLPFHPYPTNLSSWR